MTTTEQTVHSRIKWLLIALSVFVAVAGFLLVWVPYQRQMRLIEEIEATGGLFNGVFTEPVGPAWLRQLVGAERMRGFEKVYGVWLDDPRIDDAWLKRLGRLSNLEHLQLHGTQISDDGLKDLAKLSDLRELYLYDTHITDDGVKKLQRALPGCEIYR